LAVIAEFDIPVSETDLAVLHRVRGARNNLIHEGKKGSISSEDIKKAHSVVSRIVAARIATLIQVGAQ
jgi:hypothetical protein